MTGLVPCIRRLRCIPHVSPFCRFVSLCTNGLWRLGFCMRVYPAMTAVHRQTKRAACCYVRDTSARFNAFRGPTLNRYEATPGCATPNSSF